MDLLTKLESAATTNGPVTFSASEARELFARLVESEVELNDTRLKLDHVVDVLGAKRSTYEH